MTTLTEAQMKECLKNTHVRSILMERLDVENFARKLAKIDSVTRHTLEHSSEKSLEDKVSTLLDHILRKVGALQEFFDILQKDRPDLYQEITQCVVDDKRLRSSVFSVIAKFIPLDGVPSESTGCGTLVEILVAGQPLCGILAAFPVFSYRKQYSLIVVTLGSQDCDAHNFSFEADSDQYIFACNFLECSFLLLNKEQIDNLESKKCKFLRVALETYNGYYEKSIFAVNVRQNQIIKSSTSDLIAVGCQLFFLAWSNLSAGSPVLEDHLPDPATVIAVYSHGSSHSYLNSTATQCSYIVAALQRDRARSDATPYPRATDSPSRHLLQRLRELNLHCACPSGCNFLTDIQPYKRTHLLAMCRMFASTNITTGRLWLPDLRNLDDKSVEVFLQKLATNVVNGMRMLLERCNTIAALFLQEGFTQLTCQSPKNLIGYISTSIDNLVECYRQQIDKPLLDRLNTISSCLKSYCHIQNCESWITADSSIWLLVSTLEQQLSALVSTNANSDKLVLKLGILLVSVVVFLHKARLVVNCICHDVDWKVEILERLELRRTHHQWFWRVKFEFYSHNDQEKVQDVIGPWNQENVEIDHDIWQDIHALLQRVSEVS